MKIAVGQAMTGLQRFDLIVSTDKTTRKTLQLAHSLAFRDFNMKNNKVVYAWYADNLPFYIGIGSIKRSKSRADRNRHCLNKRAKAEKEGTFEVRILFQNLSWSQACEIEISLISLYGKRIDETGILTNISNGGDGTLGYKMTTKAKAAIAKYRTGRKHTKESRRKMSENTKGQTGKKNGRSKSVMTPLGKFDSCRLASAVLKCHHSTISTKAKNPENTEYYFI